MLQELTSSITKAFKLLRVFLRLLAAERVADDDTQESQRELMQPIMKSVDQVRLQQFTAPNMRAYRSSHSWLSPSPVGIVCLGESFATSTCSD
jgi:hypothetical protein